jgi:hypothetical protein
VPPSGSKTTLKKAASDIRPPVRFNYFCLRTSTPSTDPSVCAIPIFMSGHRTDLYCRVTPMTSDVSIRVPGWRSGNPFFIFVKTFPIAILFLTVSLSDNLLTFRHPIRSNNCIPFNQAPHHASQIRKAALATNGQNDQHFRHLEMPESHSAGRSNCNQRGSFDCQFLS